MRQIKHGGDHFSDYSIDHLSHSISDHCPILVNTKRDSKNLFRSASHPFRFDASWVLDGECEAVIRHFWGSTSVDLPVKLRELGKRLRNWSVQAKKNRKA